MINRIIHGDCLDVMAQIPDKSIDMVLCDLPYGTTACKWDTIIPFDPLWAQYKRIIKDNRAIVLFGSEPFSSYLRISNIAWYKYDWVWDKQTGIGHLVAKKRPLAQHENISVFAKNTHYYNPIMEKREKSIIGREGKRSEIVGGSSSNFERVYDEKYPKTILSISSKKEQNKFHPTQKPVALCEYLIKTYTSEGDLILDNCSGSGTTAIACLRTKRNFICIEKELEYVEKSRYRMAEYFDAKLRGVL